MDFTNAILAKDALTRETLVESEIEQYNWSDEVDDLLHRGGWPDDIRVEKTTIEELENQILIGVEVGFSESVPSGLHFLKKSDC